MDQNNQNNQPFGNMQNTDMNQSPSAPQISQVQNPLNNTTPPEAPVPPSQTQPMPQMQHPEMNQSVQQPMQQQPSGSKKMIFLIIGIGVLLALLAVLYFLFFKNSQSSTVTLPETTTQIEVSPSPVVTQPVAETPEEQEVLNIEEVDLETDFQDIDRDLQEL